MRFAYADPPYQGCANRYPEKEEVDHRALIERLNRDYPDGWALSCKSNAGELADLIRWAEADGRPVRLCAWVKPFAIFKPGVNPAYAWEPVPLKGGRRRTRDQPTMRDWHSENVTLRRGLVGAKPPGFNRWILALLGAQPGDHLDDLYPGTGGMADAVADLHHQRPPPTTGGP